MAEADPALTEPAEALDAPTTDAPKKRRWGRLALMLSLPVLLLAGGFY